MSYDGLLFLANVYSLIEILIMQKIIEKRFFVFDIIASELIALNSLY